MTRGCRIRTRLRDHADGGSGHALRGLRPDHRTLGTSSWSEEVDRVPSTPLDPAESVSRPGVAAAWSRPLELEGWSTVGTFSRSPLCRVAQGSARARRLPLPAVWSAMREIRTWPRRTPHRGVGDLPRATLRSGQRTHALPGLSHATARSHAKARAIGPVRLWLRHDDLFAGSLRTCSPLRQRAWKARRDHIRVRTREALRGAPRQGLDLGTSGEDQRRPSNERQADRTTTAIA